MTMPATISAATATMANLEKFKRGVPSSETPSQGYQGMSSLQENIMVAAIRKHQTTRRLTRFAVRRDWRMTAFAAALAAFAAGIATPAAALRYDYAGINMQLDTRLSEGLAVRVESRDPILIGLANGGKAYSVNADDADLGFSPGSLTEAATTLTSSLSINYGDYGLFARGSYLLDPKLLSKNFFDPSDFGDGHAYPDSVRQEANRKIQNHDGSDGTLLDLYVFGNFDISGHQLNLRVGRQIMNWGETTLVLNGLNSLVALDANKARIPGAEIDEFVIPAAQVFASVDIVEHVNVEGFYQFQWEHSIADYTGTYFSTNDYIGPGGIAANVDFGRAGEYALPGAACIGVPVGVTCVPYGGSNPRVGDKKAKNGGQYGGVLRLSLPDVNDMELAFYAANYHSRLPLFSTISASSGNVDAQTVQVFGEYPEDIHMYGTSFNMPMPGGFTLQGEYSYKPNQPIEIDDVEQSLADLGAPSQLDPVAGGTLGNQYIRGWRRKQISMIDLGTTKILAPNATLGYDDVTIIGEVALIHVHDLEDESTLRYEGPGTFLPGSASSAALLGLPIQQTGFATATSWGYKVLARATYHNVLPSLTIKPTLRYDQDIRGVTPAPLYDFVRGSRLLEPSIGFQYRSGITADIGYAYYFGGGQNNLVRDRDYAYMDLKYSF